MNGYLSKPIDRAQLRHVLATIVVATGDEDVVRDGSGSTTRVS